MKETTLDQVQANSLTGIEGEKAVDKWANPLSPIVVRIADRSVTYAVINGAIKEVTKTYRTLKGWRINMLLLFLKLCCFFIIQDLF